MTPSPAARRAGTDLIPSSCRLCGGPLGPSVVSLLAPDRFERAVGVAAEGYERHWHLCRNCGAATNVQIAENAERVSTLASAYYDVDLGGRPLRQRFDEILALPASGSDNAQRVERVASFARRWFQPSAKSRTALDIGAGLGVFLTRLLPALFAHGDAWSGLAVEPDPLAASHLRSIGIGDVIDKRYSSDLGISGDLVTLNKVIEHLVDPAALLRSIRQSALRDDGVVYVEVPDILTLRHRAATDNILGSIHHNLYDPPSLATLIRRAGLEVLEVARVFEPSGKISVFAFATTGVAVDRRALAD